MAAKLKALQQWCKVRSDGYSDVDVTNMTKSWRSGLAFCAIIHRYRPDLIDFDSLSKENVLENNRLAFTVADVELGIPQLLDAEDMARLAVPDRLSVVTYVSQFYNYFRDKEIKGGPSVRVPVKRQAPFTSAASEPQAKRFEMDHNQSQKTPTVSQSDVCPLCDAKVYLIEKHVVEGKTYHRQCYKRKNAPTPSTGATPVGYESVLQRRPNMTPVATPVSSKSINEFSSGLSGLRSTGLRPTGEGPSKTPQLATAKKFGAGASASTTAGNGGASALRSVHTKTAGDTPTERNGDSAQSSSSAVQARMKYFGASENTEGKTPAPSSSPWAARKAKQLTSPDKETPKGVPAGPSSAPFGTVLFSRKPVEKAGKDTVAKGQGQGQKNSAVSKAGGETLEEKLIRLRQLKKNVLITRKAASAGMSVTDGPPTVADGPPAAGASDPKLSTGASDSKLTTSGTTGSVSSLSGESTKSEGVTSSIGGSSTDVTKQSEGHQAEIQTEGECKPTVSMDCVEPSEQAAVDASAHEKESTVVVSEKLSEPEQPGAPMDTEPPVESESDSIEPVSSSGELSFEEGAGGMATQGAQGELAESVLQTVPVADPEMSDDHHIEQKGSTVSEQALESAHDDVTEDMSTTAPNRDNVVSKPAGSQLNQSMDVGKAPPVSQELPKKLPAVESVGVSAEKTQPPARPSPPRQTKSSEEAVEIRQMPADQPSIALKSHKSNSDSSIDVNVSEAVVHNPVSDAKPSASTTAVNKYDESTSSPSLPSPTPRKPTRSASKKESVAPRRPTSRPAASPAAPLVGGAKPAGSSRPARPPVPSASMVPGGDKSSKPPRLSWENSLDSWSDRRKKGKEEETVVSTVEERNQSNNSAPSKPVSDYPDEFNPFGEEEEEERPSKETQSQPKPSAVSMSAAVRVPPGEGQTVQGQKVKQKIAASYNPFEEEEEEEDSTPATGHVTTVTTETTKEKSAEYDDSLNPFACDEDDDEVQPSPARPPAPSEAKRSPVPAQAVPTRKKIIPGGSLRGAPGSVRRKGKAPPIPLFPIVPAEDDITNGFEPRADCSDTLKVGGADLLNGSRTGSGQESLSGSKEFISSEKEGGLTHRDRAESSAKSSEADSSSVASEDVCGTGSSELIGPCEVMKKRKPAPPRPLPPKRKVRTDENSSLEQEEISRELTELDRKQGELEVRGRQLEEALRQSEGGGTDVAEDDLLVKWLETVNEKNQLVRRESELMHITKQRELETRQSDIEYEMRLIMHKAENLKTPEEKHREEALLDELLAIVHQRSDIVDTLDEERMREREEDEEIKSMMSPIASHSSAPSSASMPASSSSAKKTDKKKKGKEKKEKVKKKK